MTPAKELPIVIEKSQFSRTEFNNLKGNKEKLFKLILEDNYIDSRFFEKTKCWSVEREYRWLLYKDSTDKIYIPIMDTLVAIVIGAYYIRNDVLDKPLKKIRKYRKEHNLNFDIFALECKIKKIWHLAVENIIRGSFMEGFYLPPCPSQLISENSKKN